MPIEKVDNYVIRQTKLKPNRMKIIERFRKWFVVVFFSFDFFSRVFRYRWTSTGPIERHNDDRQIEGKEAPRARERESGSRAPPADKMIKRQISYIIFTLMLPYCNLWEGRDLCGRVYAPRGLILRTGPTAYRQTALSAYVRPSVYPFVWPRLLASQHRVGPGTGGPGTRGS